MKILIAEDDAISRQLLLATLKKWDYEVIATKDGNEAWEVLQKPDAPKIAILDWMMPGIEGVEICKRVRALVNPIPIYIILLTSKDSKKDIIEGLRQGADDYLTKPFDPDELHVRVNVGERLLKLQTALMDRVIELQESLDHIKQLQGLLPICSYCKNIRDNKNYWQKIEKYISEHAEVNFSHGICPTCYEKYVKPQLDQLKNKK